MSITGVLVDAYLSVPIVTRVCATCTFILAIAVQLELLGELDLYFNPQLVVRRFQIWRIVSCFLYRGKIDIYFIFNILYPYRYTCSLERVEFAGRTGELILMFGFGMSIILVVGHLFGILFMSESLVTFTVYIWSRRNPDVRIDIFGLLVCRASYLPIAYLVLSFLVGNEIENRKIVLGFIVGHVYYHAQYVFPAHSDGFQVIRLPQFLKRWSGQSTEDSLIDRVVDETSTIQAGESSDIPNSICHDADDGDDALPSSATSPSSQDSGPNDE